MKPKITAKQKEVLDCYVQFKKKHGRMPTYKEAAEILGKPISTVFGYIDRLCENGHAKRLPIRRLRIIKPMISVNKRECAEANIICFFCITNCNC